VQGSNAAAQNGLVRDDVVAVNNGQLQYYRRRLTRGPVPELTYRAASVVVKAQTADGSADECGDPSDSSLAPDGSIRQSRRGGGRETGGVS
jgi:hypothetical protein